MKSQKNNGFLLQGLFLINLLFFTLFITTVLFLLGISISCINLLIAVVCSSIVTYIFSGKLLKETMISTAIGLLILFCCIFICGHVYDNSWDGNTYHKTITGLLRYGWNPLTETFYAFAKDHFPFIETTKTWFDAYPKGSEIWGACVYVITQDIEAGKSFNMLSIIAVFFICYAFLLETKKMQKWQCICCSLFAVLNPVVLSQCLTYYTDGFLGQMLLLCCVSLLYLTFYEKGRYRKLCWYFVFVSINIGFNVKFSAIIFFAILCISFFCYWLFGKVREKGFNKNTILQLKNSFLIFIISVLSGTVFIGATSYIINVIRHRNPFYTMIGEGSTEMITSQMPMVYKDMSNVERFISSIFSRTNTSKALDNVEWKIPLMFNGNEFYSAQSYDVRTAGWGVFFSGVFLIALIILVKYLIRDKKISTKLKQITTILLTAFGISICMVPGLSWARYCVVVFWIPVGALIYIFMDVNHSGTIMSYKSFIAGILGILLYLNMVPNIESNRLLLDEYADVHMKLAQLKIVSENNDIAIVKDSRDDFYGRFFNLFDREIYKFSIVKELDEKDYIGKVFNSHPIFYKITEGIKSTNDLCSFLNYLEQNEEYLLLIAVKDEATKSLKEDTIQQMRGLGLKFELKDHYRWAYLALIDCGEVIYEDMADQEISLDATIGKTNISMRSAGYLKGDIASIRLNGIEYALNKRGLNIVLYDKQSGNVIDSICIDTFNDNSLTRNL